MAKRQNAKGQWIKVPSRLDGGIECSKCGKLILKRMYRNPTDGHIVHKECIGKSDRI